MAGVAVGSGLGVDVVVSSGSGLFAINASVAATLLRASASLALGLGSTPWQAIKTTKIAKAVDSSDFGIASQHHFEKGVQP